MKLSPHPKNTSTTHNAIIPLHQSVSASALGKRHWSSRLRFQIPAMVAFVFAMQMLATFFITGSIAFNPTIEVAIFGSQIANVFAVFSFRNVRHIPGARVLMLILPTITASYAVLFGILLLFRLPYSISIIFVGYFNALLIFLAMNMGSSKSPVQEIFVVEGDLTKILIDDLPNVSFKILLNHKALSELTHGVVIADFRQDLPRDWEREIARAVLRGVPVYHVKQAYESLTGKVRFDHLSENQFGSVVPSLGYLAIKRTMDLVLSCLGLIVLFIPMIVIAFLIRMTSKGPAIFRQARVGYRGVVFDTYKFRTMAERDHSLDDLNSQMTQHDDPRITPLGRFLRQTRLDELPQLYNVLIGEMSLIGPRPEAQALSEWYYERLDFYEYRHVIRPGITGWAQVNQGHVTSLDDIYHKTQYDFYYIKNLSLSLDFLVAIKTIETVLFRSGAR